MCLLGLSMIQVENRHIYTRSQPRSTQTEYIPCRGQQIIVRKEQRNMASIQFDSWLVPRGARSWTQWSSWVPSNPGCSVILSCDPAATQLPASRRSVGQECSCLWSSAQDRLLPGFKETNANSVLSGCAEAGSSSIVFWSSIWVGRLGRDPAAFGGDRSWTIITDRLWGKMQVES